MLRDKFRVFVSRISPPLDETFLGRMIMTQYNPYMHSSYVIVAKFFSSVTPGPGELG